MSTSTRTNTRTAPGAEPGTESGVRPGTGRRALSVLLALSASVLALPGTATAQGPSSGAAAAPPSISWGACPPDEWRPPNPRTQCGALRVPLDWSKPKGEKIELFVARHRSTDPARRIGVLLSNPGGPGAPGADDVLYPDDEITGYSPDMLGRFDVVGFDPRGIGRSQGAVCDETITGAMPARPRDAAEFERLRTLNGRMAASCLERSGPLAAQMDTASVARDMDALRAALGEQKISFLGHSYGTSVGEYYARLFPERLRALALDSAMDPARPDAERYLLDGSVTVNDSLKRLAAWCEKEAAACALKGQGKSQGKSQGKGKAEGGKNKGLTVAIGEMFARADAGTLREPGPNGPTDKKVTADQLSGFLTFLVGLWSPQEAMEQIAALYTGKGEARLVEGGSDETASRLVLCRDYDLRIRDHAAYRAMLGRVAAAAPLVRYNSQSLDFVLDCQGWTMPVKPRPAQAKGALPPVLVVNATHDLATPLPGARRMARLFPNATLHTLDLVGHWLYHRDLPAKQVIDDYLTSRKIGRPSGSEEVQKK